MPRPASSKSSTPWAVRTTKRKKIPSPTEPQAAKKRPRLSLRDPEMDDHTAPRSALQNLRRQQKTLTQIQFPLRSSREDHENEYERENLKYIRSGTRDEESRKATTRRSSTRPSATAGKPRSRFGRRQRSTLTQMDFPKLKRNGEDDEEEEGDDGLNMIGICSTDEGGGCTGRDNNGAGKLRKSEIIRRESGSPEGIDSSTSKRKRTKLSHGQMEDDGDWLGTTPKTTSRRRPMTRSMPKSKSTLVPGSNTRSPPRSTRQTRSAAKLSAGRRQAESHPSEPSSDKENVGLPSGFSRFEDFETPKRKRYIVPSSQSPERLLRSSRRESAPTTIKSRLEPLLEQSPNATPTAALRFKYMRAISPRKSTVSPRRKICVLKYRRKKSSEGEGPEVQLHDRKPASGNAPSLSDPEIPETSQVDQPRVVPSSQTDSETEPEVPETSEGLRHNTSSPSVTKRERGLRMQPCIQNTPIATRITQPSEADAGSGNEDIRVLDLSHLNDARSVHVASGIPQRMNSIAAAGNSVVGDALQRTRTVSTIDDSQAEEEDISIALELSPSAAEQIQSKDRSTGTADPPNKATLADLSAFDPATTSYVSQSTTFVPTKLPPSSVPSSPAPNSALHLQSHSATRATMAAQSQRSIHPASMTRPSQVSTQSPTQDSWLPVSSLPTQDVAVSPTFPKAAPPRAIKIKDSDSIPGLVLRDIPSHSQFEGARGDGGRDASAWIDPGLGDLDRDEDLDPKSSPPLPSPSPLHQKSSQRGRGAAPDTRVSIAEASHVQDTPSPGTRACSPFPAFIHHRHTRSHSHSPPHHHTLSHDSNTNSTPHATSHSQPKRKDRDNEIGPLSQLNLPDSLLESLPGPPTDWNCWAGREEDENLQDLRQLGDRKLLEPKGGGGGVF